MQCIYLFTSREDGIVGNSRQNSSVVNSLGSFFMAPHKISLVCGFFSSLRMITVKNPYLFAPPANTNTTTMARHHTQFPLTFVNSLTPRPLAFHEIPTHRDILVQKGRFSYSSPCFSGVNFSNNISIPQVSVNIKKSELVTTFETS